MINKILNIGVGNEFSQYDRNQRRLLNGIVVLSILIKLLGLVYMISYKFVPQEQYAQTFITVLLNLAMLYFNAKGKFHVTIGVLVFLVFLGLISIVFVFKVDIYSLSLFLLSLFSFLTLIIESRRNVFIYTGFALIIVMVGILNNYYNFLSHAVTYPEERTSTIRFASIIVIAFTLFYTVYLKSYAVSYKNQLEEAVDVITEQKEKLKQNVQQKEMLLAETHHRVKNNLQLIISLLELQMDVVKESSDSEVLKTSVARINSMATIHKMLYKNEEQVDRLEMKAYLEELAGGIIQLYPDFKQKIHFTTSMTPFQMNLEKAIPIGLIINELVTNSLKYGIAKEGESNFILSNELTEKECVLTFQDNGEGIPLDAKSSLGFSIIGMLSRQIGAEVIQTNENGAKTVIKIASNATF